METYWLRIMTINAWDKNTNNQNTDKTEGHQCLFLLCSITDIKLMQFSIINMLKIGYGKTKGIEQIYILFFCNTSSGIKFLAPGIFFAVLYWFKHKLTVSCRYLMYLHYLHFYFNILEKYILTHPYVHTRPLAKNIFKVQRHTSLCFH